MQLVYWRNVSAISWSKVVSRLLFSTICFSWVTLGTHRKAHGDLLGYAGVFASSSEPLPSCCVPAPFCEVALPAKSPQQPRLKIICCTWCSYSRRAWAVVAAQGRGRPSKPQKTGPSYAELPATANTLQNYTLSLLANELKSLRHNQATECQLLIPPVPIEIWQGCGYPGFRPVRLERSPTIPCVSAQTAEASCLGRKTPPETTSKMKYLVTIAQTVGKKKEW